MITIAQQLGLGLLGMVALFGSIILRGHDAQAISAMFSTLVWGALAYTGGNVSVFNEASGEFVSTGSPTIQLICLGAAAVSSIVLYGAIFHDTTDKRGATA